MTRETGQERQNRERPNLTRLAARQLTELLARVPVGGKLPLASASELNDTLEILVPELLRARHSEWARESLDGLFYSSALKTEDAEAKLRGMCILISDQTVAPFELAVKLHSDEEIATLRIRLGEPGGGHLGISGPPYASPLGQRFLDEMESRAQGIDWVYDFGV
ncbi:hypothetical protein [Nocardioides speluncae]|uniref:hypothetical protein n=1 Tax=Nocardioides speluncae TaxID=2670337 RepID=UPI0012B185B8|nr:hypothetical protein [Nocardioides speluncae]